VPVSVFLGANSPDVESSPIKFLFAYKTGRSAGAMRKLLAILLHCREDSACASVMLSPWKTMVSEDLVDP